MSDPCAISMMANAIEQGKSTAMQGTEARHIAGQAAMVDPKIAHLVAIYKHVDDRAQAEIFAFAARQLHYPKGK